MGSFRSGELRYSLALKLFREVFKPERNLKKDDMINFVKSKFGYHEQVIRQVVKQYFIEEKMSDITLRRKSLILSPKIYKYILVTFGNESELAWESIISIFNTYIEAKVTFRPKYLDLLRKATSLEIIKPFFENFLPSVFGMKPIPKASKSRKSNNTKKRKKLAEDGLASQWVKKLEQIETLNKRNRGELSINFREHFMNFNERLEKETYFQIKENGMNNYSNEDQDDYSNQVNQVKRQRSNGTDDGMTNINMNLINMESNYYQY